MASKYGDKPKIQSGMFETGKQIRHGTSEIVRCGHILQGDNFNKNAKQDLLAAAKIVMQGTVRELHLADKYDVLKLIEAANICKQELNKTNSLTAEQLVNVARSLSAGIVNVIKLSSERIKNLADPMMKRRLDNANNVCRTETQTLVRSLGAILQNPSNQQAKQEKDAKTRDLHAALDEIIDVARASCKGMFDELDMDFDVKGNSVSIQDLRDAHNKLRSEVANLENGIFNTKKGDDAANALRQINDLVRQELNMANGFLEDCDDEDTKAQIAEAINELQSIPSGLAPQAKKALAPGASRADGDQVRKTDKELLDASNSLLNSVAPLYDGQLARVSRKILDDLPPLRDATFRGDKPDSTARTKNVVGDIQAMGPLAETAAGMTDDPDKKKRLLDGRDELKRLTPAMVTAVRGAQDNPRDAAARKRLDDALNAIARAVGGLGDPNNATLMYHTNEMFTSGPVNRRNVNKRYYNPEAEAANAFLEPAGEAKDIIARIPILLQDRDMKGLDEAMRALRDALDALRNAANDAANKDDNPDRARRIRDAAKQLDPLQKTYEDDVNAARNKPGDVGAINKVRASGDRLGDGIDRVVAAGVPSLLEQLLDNSRLLNQDLDTESDAAANGRDPTDAYNDAVDDARRQLAAAGALAALTPDNDKKARLKQAMDDLLRSLEALKRATDNMKNNPNDPRAKQELEDAIRRVRDADAAIVAEAYDDPIKAALEAQDRARKAMQAMRGAIQNKDKAKAQAIIDDLQTTMRRQAALCKAIARSTKDPKSKAAILQACMAINNAILGMIATLQDMISKEDWDGALKTLDKLLAEFNKVDKKLRDALIPQTSDDPVPKDEIDAAAMQVKKAISRKHIDESTAEGRVYAAAQRVAEDMILLSEASRKGGKSDVIFIARRIAQHVADMHKNAQQVCDKCKDPILRDQVMSIAHAVRNISTQLKIITAVKATTDREDPTVRAQLVKCAKQLANNTVGIVNAVEVASIKF